jgi:hypothetical protein
MPLYLEDVMEDEKLSRSQSPGSDSVLDEAVEATGEKVRKNHVSDINYGISDKNDRRP